MKAIFRSSLVASAALLLVASGCGDDPVNPGEVVVNWTHGATPTCETRHVVRLQARALRGTTVVGVADGDCAKDAGSGSLTITGLAPQSYTIEVEAYDSADKGTHIGVAENIAVPDGGTVETAKIQLNRKPIDLTVDWTVPGGKCAGSPIKQVRIDIIPDGGENSEVEETQTVACDNTFTIMDADGNPVEVPGVHFDAIKPNLDLYILASGLDSAGAEIAGGRLEHLELLPGDVKDEVVDLLLCNTDGSVCD